MKAVCINRITVSIISTTSNNCNYNIYFTFQLSLTQLIQVIGTASEMAYLSSIFHHRVFQYKSWYSKFNQDALIPDYL